MEWLGIRLRTNKSEWTPMQAAMMRDAAWRATRKALALLGGLAALSLAAWLTYQSFERRRLAKEFELDRDALYALEISEDNRIRGVIADLVTQHRDRIDVTELFQEFDRPDGTGSREKTIDAMLLVQLGQATDRHRDYLMNQMINNSAGEAKLWQVIHRFLESRASDYLTKELQNRLSTNAAPSPAEMLRINASAIGLKDEKFLQMLQGQQNLSNDIVAALLQEPVNNMGIWTDGLLKIKASLAPQVMTFLEKNTLTSNRAQNAAAVLRAFDDGLSTSTVQALSARSTEIEEFQAIMDQLQRLDDAPKNVLIADLGRRLQELDPQLDRNEEELRTCVALPIARLALVAWQLGDPTYLEQITAKAPRYGLTRGLVIEMLAQTWTEFDATWRLATLSRDDDPLLPVALLSIEEELSEKYATLPGAEKQKTISRFLRLATEHPTAEVHATALLLWRKLNGDTNELPKEVFRTVTDGHNRQWRLSTPS
jgi:hypothetical protein